MCFNVDQGLIVSGLVLLAILALLFLARVWIACGDYLLRRRMTLRQYVGGGYARFEARFAERLVGPL
ncbi:hypothetical protein ACSFBI_18930 [Variovorax sp. RB3P1]|uniref:hypothetical protein n=1 Tax=Variovorax sp. RB3P1 TaxID=3443732 RepID=UPI003F454F5E